MKHIQGLVLFSCMAFAGVSSAGTIYDGHVRAELVSDVMAVQSGEPFWVGLKMDMDEGWHTYWRNSGDSGLPTKIDWQLPDGFEAGEIQWPTPQLFDYGNGLAGYGYEGEVILLARMMPPKEMLTGQNLQIKAQAKWLSCHEICVPGRADLALNLITAAEAKESPQATVIADQVRALPSVDNVWKAAVSDEGEHLVLKLSHNDPDHVSYTQLAFFPYRNDMIYHAASQIFDAEDHDVRLTLSKSSLYDGEIGRIEGILVDMVGGKVKHGALSWAIDAKLEQNESQTKLGGRDE